MFGGFDRDSYQVLGDGVMGPIRGNTTLRWIGFYLAHSAIASGSTWTARHPRNPPVSTWRFLRSEGWGVAPIFLARQFTTDAAGHSAPNPNWTEANGILDGNHAVALANASDASNLVDIERGATLYLDLEADGFVSVPAAQNYLRGWFNTVRAAGYRPGAYCANPPASVHPAWISDGQKMRALFPDVAIWFIRVPGVQPKVYDDAAGRLTVLDVSNFLDDDGTLPMFGFVASQFAWYNPDRAHQSAKLKTGPTSFHTVGPIDFDASRLPNPAHPEDRAALTFSAFRPGEPAVFSLEPSAAAWQYHDGDWGQWGQLVCRATDTPMNDLGYGRWFDTHSVAAASRQPGLVDVFGVGIDGSVWTAWRSADAGGVDGTWSPVPQLISASGTARHGSAIAAVSRKLDTLDVFFFNANQEMATTWWHPADMNWLAHSGAITHGFAFAPASNIAALVSPTDTERLDVFAVDAANVLRWVQWRNSGAWQSVTVPLASPVDPAVGVQGAWFAGQLHLIVGMRDGSLIHLSHPDGVLATPWVTRGVLPSLGGLVRPMGVAVSAIDAALVAVLIASNQTLVWSAFEGTVWGVLGLDTATPPYSSSGRIAAQRFDGNAVDVMLPNHEGAIVMRRLTRGPIPFAPLTLTHAWEMIL